MALSLSSSIFILLVYVIKKGVHASCSLPESLNMARDDPPWYSHVRHDGSRDTEYYIRHNVMEIHYPNSDEPHVRWKCLMSLHGKFLLKRQDTRVNSFYKCVKFLFRSRSIVQLMWSNEIRVFDPAVCDDSSLILDPWILIRFDSLEIEHKKCPFSGGFDMNMTDSQLGANGCNFMYRPMRLEVECLGGEGVNFDYISSDCLPDINMFVKQRTLCVSDWEDSHNNYIVLRRNEDIDLWCLVVPKQRGNDVTAYLYSDLACHHDVTSDVYKAKDLKFFELKLHTRVFQSLCEDEYPQCSDISCNDYTKHQCRKSCRVCSPKDGTKTCNFPRRFVGSWILKNSLGLKDVNFRKSTMTIGDNGCFKCVDFPDSPPRKMRTYTTVSIYKNGCRPRYTCTKLQRLGPSVLMYSLSQSFVWPSLEENIGSTVCSEHQFYPDPSPIDDLYRNNVDSGKPIVSKNPRPEFVRCNLTSFLTLNSTLQQGHVCSGRLYQHCGDDTKLRLEYDNCTGLCPSYTDYNCLANYQGHYWERILLVQNVLVDEDVVCFIFSQLYPGVAYSMVASQCNKESFNFVRGGLLKPLLKLNVRSENKSCGSIPMATTSSTISKQKSSVDSHLTMSDSSLHGNDTFASERRSPGYSLITSPPTEKVVKNSGIDAANNSNETSGSYGEVSEAKSNSKEKLNFKNAAEIIQPTAAGYIVITIFTVFVKQRIFAFLEK